VEDPTREELIQALTEICKLTANPVTESRVRDLVSAMRLIDKVWLISFDVLVMKGKDE
jgi:hypothetical protein